jgi:MoxR-like ATPase
LPEYIHSRLQPQILIDFPGFDEELAILKQNLPFSEDEMLEYVAEFLQHAHAGDEHYTARDGINIARYATKLIHMAKDRYGARTALHQSILHTLGEEALRYVPRT